MYKTCEHCGSHLDFAEKCDCQKEKEADNTAMLPTSIIENISPQLYQENTENARLIIIKQLPVIETRLKEISKQVESKVNEARNLVVTKASKQVAKKIKAELNSNKNTLETLRKEVKKAVLEPYDTFENMYKQQVKFKYDEAERIINEKISIIEMAEKDEILLNVKTYFDEYKSSCDLKDLVIDYKELGINVNLTSSLKSYKDRIRSYFDSIVNDLNTIDSFDNKEEIYVEYKDCRNLATAISRVNNRKADIEKLKVKPVEEVEPIEVEPVEDVPLTAPTVEPVQEVTDEGPVMKMTFSVTAPVSKLKELKAFLDMKGYTYE